MFPATLFVTLVFRSSHSKPKQTENRCNAATETRESTDDIYDDTDDIDALIGQIYKESDIEEIKTKPSSRQMICENFLLILAWTIANLAVVVSAFFLILYSMEWGSSRSNAWLVAFLISLLENVLLADPIKVCLALHHVHDFVQNVFNALL